MSSTRENVNMRFRFFPILLLVLLLTACSIPGTTSTKRSLREAAARKPVSTPTPSPDWPKPQSCPDELSANLNCYTPRDLRIAYNLESLVEQGFTGKGQTVVDIVPFGSPTVQEDMDIFDKQFGIPSVTVQVYTPVGQVPSYNPDSNDMVQAAAETELDVQVIHAIAPGAGIAVLALPNPSFFDILNAEQYAVDNHLGQIFSQSFGIPETFVTENGGQGTAQRFANFYKEITTQKGITIVSASGDNGATDWADTSRTRLSPIPTVDFPADVPWVTAVGGTTLTRTAKDYNETAWPRSGGGVSKLFTEPDFQQALPPAVQSELAGYRGLPDVAADADPRTGMAFYFDGQWAQVGGTSASAPFWAGIVAVANQMAGHPLGFINPGIYQLAALVSSRIATVGDFRDIISGDNSVNDGTVQVKGFSAVPGWDAVTGWGTPQAQQFIPDLIAVLSQDRVPIPFTTPSIERQ